MHPHTDLAHPGSETNSSHSNLPRRSRARCTVNDASLPLTATVIPHHPYQEGHRQLISKYVMESQVTRDGLSTIRQHRSQRVVLIQVEPVTRDSLPATHQQVYSRILASLY